MINKFKMTVNHKGENWNICHTGQDIKGNEYSVTTNAVRASELDYYTLGAKGDAELIARLLNWYYTNKLSAELEFGIMEINSKQPHA